MRISDWSSDVCSSDLQEQTDASFQPPLETGGGDQPLGEGSGFAAGLTLAGADLDAGLVASGLLATGTLGGVEASGFGLLALDDSFTFLLDRPVEGPEPPIPEPPINVVYLIDISETMDGSGDGTPTSQIQR